MLSDVLLQNIIHFYCICTYYMHMFSVMSSGSGSRTATNNHHPHSAVERVYLPCSAGGVGLVNIENLYYRKLAGFTYSPFDCFI